MKIIYVHCGEETNIIDPRSYKQDLKKKIQARVGFEPSITEVI